MNKLSSKVIIIILILCLSMSTIGLAACNDKKKAPPQKPDFDTVIATYNDSHIKKGTMSSLLTISLYDTNGEPFSFSQSINTQRQQDNQYYLYGATVYTERASQRILDLVNFASRFMGIQEIYDYMLGETSIILKAGYGNGTYNAKLDLIQQDEEPDFVIADRNNNPMDVFGGISEGDIAAFLDSLGYVGQLFTSIKDLVMLVPFQQLDWDMFSDDIGSDLNAADNKFHYKLKLSGESLKEMLFSLAESYLADFEEGQSEDITQLNSIYRQRKELINSIFTLSPLVITAQVGRGGLIEKINYDFTATLKISDEQILSLFEDGDTKANIAGVLALLHALFITTKNKEKNKTEITFAFTGSETFEYGKYVDKADNIFAAADDDISTRTMFGFVYDEQKQEYIFTRLPQD